MRLKTSLPFLAVLAAVTAAPALAAGPDAKPPRIVAAMQDADGDFFAGRLRPTCNAPFARSIACWPRPSASPPRRSASASSGRCSAGGRYACPTD